MSVVPLDRLWVEANFEESYSAWSRPAVQYRRTPAPAEGFMPAALAVLQMAAALGARPGGSHDLVPQRADRGAGRAHRRDAGETGQGTRRARLPVRRNRDRPDRTADAAMRNALHKLTPGQRVQDYHDRPVRAAGGGGHGAYGDRLGRSFHMPNPPRPWVPGPRAVTNE